ncbi:MAG: LamG domain-containing protein, partial [Phycisphaerae bacterium]|nr:LamG domain-containing protein [Phycisphaerae bacterium]
MKNRVLWMFMLTLVLALVASDARAVWDPDSDVGFLLDFENNPNAYTTMEAIGPRTGTLQDYNSASLDMFGGDAIRGEYCADFNQFNDENVGAPNDCRFSVPPTDEYDHIFEFGDENVGFPQMGYPGNDARTFAFWFNMPDLKSGTFFRRDKDEDYYYEVRALNGKLEFRHSQNCIRFETGDMLETLGVAANTWHHAVVVVDRSDVTRISVPSTAHSAKMFVDGVEAPILITYLNTAGMYIDSTYAQETPLMVGAGDRNFDGLLDELRIYKRALSALEVSLLYQNDPCTVHTTAILPIPSSSNVSIVTDVNWIPAAGATAQVVYFGTDDTSLPQVASGSGSLDEVSNATLGGPFPLDTTYYWYVKSTVGGSDIYSPVWSFTTETGKAYNPIPVDGQVDVAVSDVNIYWSASATAESFDVYYSTDRTLVEDLNALALIADDITATQVNDVNTKFRSQDYYWRVVSNYSAESVAGDIWTFTSRPYEIVFNVRADKATTYQDQSIPALTCMIHADGWTTIATGTLDTDANIAIFDFNSDFSYDKRYDITVVPAYRAQDVNSSITIRPLGINVDGNFYFDGKIRIAGDDILTTSDVRPYARSGGFTPPRANSGITTEAPDNACWTAVNITAPYHNRYSVNGTTSSKPVYVPNAKAYALFGPGSSVINPPYKGGGGAGHGGDGGNCGRGYYFGLFSGGYAYGGLDVPVPLGGSGGGWGSQGAGTPGGGGVEITATGNVVLDVSSEIR